MTHVSILLPQRNAGDIIVADLPALLREMDDSAVPFELVIIDDASAADTLRLLDRLAASEPSVRLVRLYPARGLSAALSAGLAIAEGQHVVMLPPGDPCSPQLIQPLLDALVRVDLVVGRPHRQGINKLFHRLTRIPRWLLLGLEVRDPECQAWAARREAVSDLDLGCGMHRYLADLVAMRGFRVGEIPIPTDGRNRWLTDNATNPGDLLATWWLKRRRRQYQRIEVVGGAGTERNEASRAEVGQETESETKNGPEQVSTSQTPTVFSFAHEQRRSA